ncbi:radical SAM/SPASM domain-containing protein [Chengkuizengella sediminis]|uniref:radical SAM/SPASM domain-containing protein n=1 Tax=Chengkuizengella sediminis TaxID=1885917 RepID=UPI0013896B04|nr:radical SAM protein [Chengkuizengella sediminis]NDI34215.1 radical SAM protein [Chengkuizengella sediminis]
MLTKAGNLGNEKLLEHVQNLTPQLKQITIFASDLCNYRCSFCHIWGETGWALKEPQRVIKEQVDIDVIKKFMDQVLEVNPKIGVIITGGEPMLYKNFTELVEYLRSKKVTIYLLTNGSLIKNKIDLILNNVVALNISIDGPEEYHDSIRGKGSFQQICENIELLIKEKKKRKRMFPFININMTLSKYNYQSAKPFLSALRDRFSNEKIILHDTMNPWVKPRDLSVNFWPLLFTTREKGKQYAIEMKELLDCDVSPAWEGFVEDPIGIDTKRLKNDLEDIWESEGVDSSNFVDVEEYFNNIENVFGRSKCLAPWHELIIRRTGDVYPCVDFPDYKLGNIHESSFEEIWTGDKVTKFREVLKTQNLNVCNRCTRLFADKESF